MNITSSYVISLIIRQRRAILAIVGLITMVLGAFIPAIRVDNDPTHTIPPDLKEYVEYKRLKEVFSSPRSVVLIARFGPLPLEAKIDSMARWGQRFEQIEGIDRTVHLATLRVPVKGGLFGLKSDQIVSTRKKLTEEQVRERIDNNRALTRTFISDDESVLSMVMNLNGEKNQVQIVSQVEELKERIDRSSAAEIYITGAPLYAYSIDRAMKRDFSLLLPLVLAVVFLLLLWVFRRLDHVLVSLAITAIALVWTFGLMGISGMPFSVVTSMIPVILFPIGVASAIHVLKTYSRYRENRQTSDKIETIQGTFGELMKPIFLSAVTTFVGFASFSFSRVIWTKTFGIFTSIGVALALLLSIVLLPIYLFVHRERRGDLSAKAQQPAQEPSWFSGAYRRLVSSLPAGIALAVAIAAVSIVGISMVRVEGNPISFFAPQSNIRKTDELVTKYLGGTRFLSILLEPAEGDFQTRENWQEVDRIVDYAAGLDMVGGATSLLVLIKRVGTMISNEPISDAAVSLLLGSKGLLGKSFQDYLGAWITPDREKTKIGLICKNVSGTRFLELSRRIERHVRHQHKGWDVLVAGPPILNDAMTFVLIETQISSMILAFGSVLIVLCLLFRSLKIGLFAIIPIVFSTAFVYSLMGLAGVAINAVTIITVNTCIGVGIDYAIHFVAGYLFFRRGTAQNSEAVMRTARVKGSVIMFNTFVVGIGFLVLSFSSFPPIRHFGIFVFVSMVASAVFALVFLPILFGRFQVVSRPVPVQRRNGIQEGELR